MRIALVDDEQRILTELTELLSRQLHLMGDDTYSITTYHSGEEFLSAWRSGYYDLVVLDMFMDGMPGVDVARKIRETDRDVRLVFCTSSNDFACESYEVDAHYYLLKPFTEQSVKRMLDRLNLEIMELIRSVTLPDGQRLILRDVLSAQYAGHTAEVHCKKSGTLTSRITHRELEELLCQHNYFVCCSKGVIVNFYEVSTLSEDAFLLSDGSSIPISRRKAKAVRDAYASFLFDQMRKEVRA